MAFSNFHLPSILQTLSASLGPISNESGNVTNVPETPRQLVGPAALYLHPKLLDMYWASVKREMKHILLTLRIWQQPPYASTVLPDEEDDFIHGYDTFLEHLSQCTRGLAQRHGKNVAAQKKSKKDTLPSYHAALQDRCWDIFAEERNSALKEEMRMILESRSKYSILQQRARMLLQSAGFLDIDKVMEYRPPEKDISFWKRPAVPQLKILRFDENKMPVFGPETCTTCKATIRGCTFRSGDIIDCEDCYRKYHYGRPDFVKSYKHSILSKAITCEAGHSICHCTGVRRTEDDGSPRALFPVDEAGQHRGTGPAAFRCGLFEIPELVAETKYREVLLKPEKHDQLTKLKSATTEARRRRRELLRFKEKPGKTEEAERATRLVDTKQTFAEFGQSALREKEDDVPLFLRPIVDKYPFGNVHMALRVGPLLIENGVKHTKKGALITSRDPSYLQVILGTSQDLEDSLLLTDEEERTLWTQKRKRMPKRYKCMMKQVIGGAFAGVLDPQMEEEIVDALITESQQTADPGLPVDVQAKALDNALDRLVNKLKEYLGSRIEKYLRSIAGRLTDRERALRWNFRTNNCQMFCDSLLDNDLFGSLFAPSGQIGDEVPADIIGPLYLMSFVCRPGSYDKETVLSKYDVPNGLTEEYLLKFRYGRHEESDVIDTLQEYWHDWGAFGGPIYPYQDLFPWDCTEAYNRYPTKCGNCNISKHVLAFPFDSWSIISLHLSKGRYLYPPPASSDPSVPPTTMDDTSWFRNRLMLLLAQSRLLSAAGAMHASLAFRSAMTWLAAQPDAKLDRLKLGGIHRAQPYSHHFEKGAYHHYFVAGWTHLRREQQVAAYEALRDGRARRDDVSDSSSRSDGGDGCGMWVCAALMTTGSCGNCGNGNCNSGGGDGGGGGGGDGGGDGGGGGGCGGCGGC